ncbi:hypothetical protein HG530_005811 [Fusarium avenaceum]|nr:hypothetical protein HG530_005811 [Fusarium avenaceum]
MISEATRQEADRKEAEYSTSLQNNKRRLDEVYAKSNRLRHQLSHYQKLFPEETPDPGHHAAGKEPATAARPKTATRNKGQNKAPPEHPDKTWSETYRGASAGQKLKLDPNALPYLHGVFNSQSSTGPYERLVTAQLEHIKLKRKVQAPPEQGDGSDFDIHQDPISFIYNDERFPATRNYTPLVQVYNRDEKKWVLSARQPGSTRRFTALDRGIYTMEQARGICQKLTDALNRWPNIEDISSTLTSLGAIPVVFYCFLQAAQASCIPTSLLSPLRLAFSSKRTKEQGETGQTYADDDIGLNGRQQNRHKGKQSGRFRMR